MKKLILVLFITGCSYAPAKPLTPEQQQAESKFWSGVVQAYVMGMAMRPRTVYVEQDSPKNCTSRFGNNGTIYTHCY